MSDKPIHAKPSLYAFYFELIKEIGLKFGYNIVLHGSMNRDLDLIAIPWESVVGDKSIMLNEICEAIGGDIMNEDIDNFKKFSEQHHGREAYIININRYISSKFNGVYHEFVYGYPDPQYYIDISILPTKE